MNQTKAKPLIAGRKTCKVCKTPIFAGAKKCTACSSYQDWRRIFSISNTTLSLIVALLALISPALTAINSYLHKPQADIKISIPPSQSGYLTVAAYNDGDRTGVIFEGAVQVNGGKLERLVMLGNGGDYLIAPNQASLTRFLVVDDLGFLPKFNDKCVITLLVTGNIEPFLKKKIDCGLILPVFEKSHISDFRKK